MYWISTNRLYMLSFIISQASVFRPGVYDLGWYQHWCDAALVCCGGSLMDIHCTRAWRLLGHSRHSPCPLSSLKGFTLELLKVLHVSKRIAAVSSFWTAIAGSSSPIGIGSSNTLGLLWRSLVVTCLFVSKRNRNIYWGYVEPQLQMVPWMSECD